MRLQTPLAFLLFCGLFAAGAHAVVSNSRVYHLGEADPGAVPLGAGNAQTIDSGPLGVNADKVGLTFYNGTSPSQGLGLVPGSSMSMRFTNVDSRYQAAALAGLSDNFGVEAYIQSTTNADARPFYNGGDGTPLGALTDGIGLVVSGGVYKVAIGPTLLSTGVAVVPGTPVEMAVVDQGGTFSVYINDVLKNSAAVAYAPATATDKLSIGNFVGNDSPPNFAGVVDEARIFTFTAGSFDPGIDLGPAAVPEPSTLMALFCLAPFRPKRRLSRR